MRAVLVAGLAFGDEGKGACVDALTRHYGADLIVRYNGGCQCAHHVVLPNGTSHCFSQFGSGMLANDTTRTFLSRFVLVEPLAMIREAAALSNLTSDVWNRISVDAQAPITTPLHRQLNRLREDERGKDRHGSCGRGIGVTRELQLKHGDAVLLAGDFRSMKLVREKLFFLWGAMKEETLELIRRKRTRGELAVFITPDDVFMQYDDLFWPATIVDDFPEADCAIFEGAQGVMLDEKHGTAPHNTWTNTTFENADTLLDEAAVKDRFRIGCLRSYYTRHGAGPFPTEDSTLNLPEPHNGTGIYQGRFRVGSFDFNLAKEALSIVGGVDALGISHIDYLPRLEKTEDEFTREVEDRLKVYIGLLGRGPTASHRGVNVAVTD